MKTPWRPQMLFFLLVCCRPLTAVLLFPHACSTGSTTTTRGWWARTPTSTGVTPTCPSGLSGQACVDTPALISILYLSQAIVCWDFLRGTLLCLRKVYFGIALTWTGLGWAGASLTGMQDKAWSCNDADSIFIECV